MRHALLCAGLCLAATLGVEPAAADKIKNPTAVFAGLDKITGRIISFEVAMDETVQFGSLQITPRVCFSRPPTEAPQTDVFAEVDEIGESSDYKRVFTGWMFAASPGLHGVEHPVYDIWLTDCKGGTEVIHTQPEEADLTDNPPPDDSAPGGAAASPNGQPQQQPANPQKKRKVAKPAADPNAGQDPVALDASGIAQPTPRHSPSQRFFPTDAPPVPPANIPGGSILNRQ
jgi:hypothetical protein